jgi:hypothetical protein
MRYSGLVRAADCLCKNPNSPGFNPSILTTQWNQRAADEALFNNVHKINFPLKIGFLLI